MNKKFEELIKAGIKDYAGVECTDVKIYPDPKVDYTYAVRATLEDQKEPFDCLFVGIESSMSVRDISDRLEEAEFETWPPKSGALKFMW